MGELDVPSCTTYLSLISASLQSVIERFLSLGLGYIKPDVENAFRLNPQHEKGTSNITTRGTVPIVPHS